MKNVLSVADVLEREIAPTIKEWLRRVNLVPELTDIQLSDSDRTNHLPELFDDVLWRLRVPRDTPQRISFAAAAHGKTRLAQGYSAAMLIEESRIFQATTLGTLHLYQNELDRNQLLLDVMTIADEAHAQLMESVRSLVVQRKVSSASSRRA